MTMRRAWIPFAAAVLAASCDSSVALSSRNVAAGDGIVATLAPDGTFLVTKNGARILGTDPKSPLFSREIDTDNPNGFHAPRALDNVTLETIGDASITIDSPAAGVVHLATVGDGLDTVLVSLALASDDGFYGGLGERFEHADARGDIVGMQLEINGSYESATTDRHVPVPWFVSSKGYAVFVKSRESGAFDVAATNPSVVRATFEGKTMDVTILIDPDPIALVTKLTQLTGLPRKTPASALAPMLWRHVDSEAQLFSDLAQIRSLHIPTSTFWIDDGWQNSLNSLHFDLTKYPDLPSISSRANALGFEMWGWNSPYLENPKDPPADEAQQLWSSASAAHDFVQRADGTVYYAPGPDQKNGFGMIDFSNPAARAFWAGRVGDAVSAGFHGFKLDYGEDAVPDLLNARQNLAYFDGTTDRTARNYPLGYHGAYRDALAAVPGGGVLIVRASTYGGAAVADVIWPGDLDNGFQHRGDRENGGPLLVGGLPASVVAAQSLTASGFPLYGADVGGYRGETPTKESLLRWSEASALSMVMQLGPGEKKYPWNYDAETVAIYTQLARLHQKLFPYLTTLLEAAQTGTPTIRSLPLAFPQDHDAMVVADDEYLLGPSLLCAPIVNPGVDSRIVHLPTGTWFSWWTGARFDGPTSITVPAPLGQPPLFVLAGSMLQTLPDGIDTVFPSTDPGVVSMSAMAQYTEARAWPSDRISMQTTAGGYVSIVPSGTVGYSIYWQPASTERYLTLTIDFSAFRNGPASISQVSAPGASIANAATEADVRKATGNAYFLAGNRLVLRIDGDQQVDVQ